MWISVHQVQVVALSVPKILSLQSLETNPKDMKQTGSCLWGKVVDIVNSTVIGIFRASSVLSFKN